jgi:hypothetical protein
MASKKGDRGSKIDGADRKQTKMIYSEILARLKANNLQELGPLPGLNKVATF